MPNVATYLGNVSKSIAYSAVDQIKVLSPSVAEMVEQNAELTKEVYELAKDYKSTIKKASDFVIASDVGQAAIQMKKSIMEDLKSGKFYNRKRIDEMEIKATGGLLDFDMGDPFAELDGIDTGDDNWDNWEASFDDQFLAESMDATGEKIVSGVAEVTFRSADYIVGANTKNAAAMQRHNEMLINKVGTFINATNSSILKLVEFNEKSMTTHINNSQKFYDFTTNNLTSQLELLKKISDSLSVYGQYKLEPKKPSDRITFDDIVGAEGMPDLKQYFKMVGNNINNLTGGLLELNKSMGGNMLMTLAGSPLKFITDSMVKTIIPKTMKEATDSLNKTLSGVFSSLMIKAENIASNSDNEFYKKVAELLGTNTGIKYSLDTSRYNRGAIPFDGETKTAILNISNQMSKVISLLSGKPEKVFDYQLGKWTSIDQIKDLYSINKLTEKDSKSASSDLRNLIKEMTSRTDFGTAANKRSFEKSLDNMFAQAYSNGGLFGFNKDPYDFAMRMGIDYSDIKYIIPLLNEIKRSNRHMLMTYNNEIMNRRSSHNRRMKASEEDPSSIQRLLYNNYEGDEFVNYKKNSEDKNVILTNPYDVDIKRNKSPLMSSNLVMIRDNRGKNVFDYLQKTVYELEYIRRNGGGSGFGGRRGKNRTIVPPEPFIDQQYVAGHKTFDEQELSEYNKREERYLNERERMYNREWEEKKKDKYYNQIFTASERFDGLEEEDEIRAYSNYLATRTDLLNIDKKRKENNLKQEKKNAMPGWIKAFLDMDAVDDRVATFMTGVFDLSQKPAEFLSRMVERTDKALFDAIYGNEDEDKLTKKSFMGQLIARMTTTFANFGDFLKDDILDPLKEQLFGREDGIVSKAKKKITDKVRNADFSSVKEFVMGSYEINPETGERYRVKDGMFGSKIDYVKKNMKDVYRTPIKYLEGNVKVGKNESEEDARRRIQDLRTYNKEVDRINKEAEDRAANSIFRFIDDKYIDQEGNIDPRLFSTREEVMKDIANRRANGENIPNYYNGSRYINKTGIAAVSEGEMIIPAELNPFYNKKVNKLEQKLKENSAKRDFAKYINGLSDSDKIKAFDIPGYANGTTSAKVYNFPGNNSRESRTQASRSTQGSRDDAAASEGHINWFNPNGASYEINKQSKVNIRDRFIAGEESIGYKIGDEVKNFFGFMSAIGINKDNIKERLSNASETFAKSAEKISQQMADAVGDGQDSEVLYNDMVKDIKGGAGKYLPSMLGGGLVGAGVSLVTGAIGGPLLGAAIGAATDLTINSGAVQNWLFGEYGSDGKRRGNVLSKDLSNNIEKYFPNMAKGAVVGGITTILPFVPGGPVAGIVLGSAIGFAKSNDKIREYLFGTEDTEGLISKQTQKTLKAAIPSALLGGAVGAFVGPFGFVGNILAGSAIGFAVKTNKFQEMIFGKQNENGETEGGLINTIKEGFVNPIIDFGGSAIDRLHNWFKKDIADPLVGAIAPITKSGQLLVAKLAGAITGKVGEMMDNEMETFKVPLGQWFNEKIVKPAGRFAKGAINVAAYPAGRIISSPFRFIGGIGDIARGRQVASGNATYMTAAERLRFREEVSNNVKYERYTKDERDEDGNLIHRKGEFVLDENGEPIIARRKRFGLLNDLNTGRRNRKDKFKDFDNMLVNTDIEDLQSMSDSLSYLKSPNKVAQNQKRESVDRVRKGLTKLPFNMQQKILNSLNTGDFQGAMEYVRRLSIDPDQKRQITQLLTQEYSNFEAAGQLMNDEEGSKQKIMARLRQFGFKDINVNNIDKYKTLIDQEINNKSDEKSEIEILNQNQDTRHIEIVDLFKSAIDEIRAIRDPKYAEQLATNKFEKNMYEASKKRGIFKFMDSGNSNLFGNYAYKAEMGANGKLHYYRVDEKGNKQLVDEQGRPIDEDGHFTEQYDEYEQYYRNNESAQNTTGRNALNTAESGLLGLLERGKQFAGKVGTTVGNFGKYAWNGATYEERAEKRSANYNKEQERWKGKVEAAGITIPENFSGSYKELWKEHFYGKRNLVKGAESDDVKYVSDSDGKPIKWIRNTSGQWEIDTSDAETKGYLSAGEKAQAIAQKTADTLSEVAGTVKQGFMNLFNIDEERDGWLKTTAKIGVGILGALTVAGFGPILENWYHNTAVPAIHNLWEEKVAPKLGQWLEPVKPTLARMAAGLDSTIRSIPFAIESVGDKIKFFFKNDFPDLMTNKIIPFYRNGIQWLGDKTSWIVENGMRLIFNIAPQIIHGAIKGAWQFMKNDIFTLFGGYGRRDAASLLKSTSSVSKGSSNRVRSSSRAANSSLAKFSGFSSLYSNMMGETPQETLSGKPASAKELEPYYSGTSSTLPPVPMATLDGGTTYKSNRNNIPITTPTSNYAYLSDNNFATPQEYGQYAESYGSSYDYNSIDSNVINDYNQSVKANTEVGYNVQYNSGTQSIQNWNRTSIDNASAEMMLANGVDPNAVQVLNPNADFIVDSSSNEVYNTNGEKVGYYDGNSIFDYQGNVYDNNSIRCIIDGNNQSIASRGIKASIRSFLTGKGSLFSRKLVKFGQKRGTNVVTRTLRRSVGLVGNTIEASGKLGAAVRNGLKGKSAIGEGVNNLFGSVTNGLAKSSVKDEWNKLVAEATSAGWNLDDAHKWAAENITDSRINIFKNIDKGIGNAASNIGMNVSGEAITSAQKGLAKNADEMIEALSRTGSSQVTSRAILSSADDVITSGGLLKTVTSKITKFFDNIVTDKTIKKYMQKALAKSGQAATDQAVTNALKTLSKEGKEALIQEFAGSLVKSGSKAVKVLGHFVPYINFIFAAADFISGWSDAPSIMGVLEEDCALWQKFACGVANLVNGYLTLGLIPLSVLVDLFVNILAPLFNINVDEFMETRQKAGEALAAYNEEHGTELTLDQFNKKDKFTTKVWTKFKSFFGFKNPYESTKKKSTVNFDYGLDKEYNTPKNTLAMLQPASGTGSGITSPKYSMLGDEDGRTLICQNNPIYDKMRFNTKEDTQYQTFGDSACGPASAAMVLNKVNGTSINLKDAAKYALENNNKVKNGGVDLRYFNDYYALNGLQAQYTSGISNITHMLKETKNPIVLLGQDVNNTSKTFSPFGPNNHYVVVNKITPKTVYVNDPEQNRANIPYDISILKNAQVAIGATKGMGKGVIPNKFKSLAGTGFGAPRMGLRINKNTFRPMKVHVNGFNPLNRLSGRGSADIINQYSSNTNIGNIDTTEGRSTNILNEIVTAIMVLESSINIASVNYKADADGNIGIGIMQWKGQNASTIINKIISKNPKAAKSIIGESSTVYINATKNKAIKGDKLTSTSRNNLTTLLSSAESKNVQFEEAKSLANTILGKCKFTNPKTIILWSAVYNHDPEFANKLQNSSDMDTIASVNGLYGLMQSFESDFNKFADKYSIVYGFVQSSPCTDINHNFDTSLLEKVVTVSEDSVRETNFLTRLFSKITELGQLFFFGTTGEKESSSNIDDSYSSNYSASLLDIDPEIADAMDPYMEIVNDREKLLVDRITALNKMINIDRPAAILLFETGCTELVELLSTFDYFNDNYVALGATSDSNIRNKASILSNSLVGFIETEAISKLNLGKQYFDDNQDLDENYSIINELFVIQTAYFECFGSVSDASNIKFSTSKLSNRNSVIQFNKVSLNSKGRGAFDNDFFNYRLSQNKTFITQLQSKNTRGDILDFLKSYSQTSLINDINAGHFLSEENASRNMIEEALNKLGSDEYSLEAKEEAWNIAEGLINTAIVNNPNFGKEQLIEILDRHSDVHDFDYMRDPNYKVNTTTNSKSAKTGFMNDNGLTIQQKVSAMLPKESKNPLFSGSLVAKTLGITSQPTINALENINYQTSANAVNPYTAQRILNAKNLKGLRNTTVQTGMNLIDTFENIARGHWLLRTDQGMPFNKVNSPNGNILDKIVHPNYRSGFNRSYEYNKGREYLADRFSDSATDGRDGAIFSAMKQSDEAFNSYLYPSWQRFYSLWKSDPRSIGGPFEDGYKFNKIEYFKASREHALDQENVSKGDAVELQESIAKEILGVDDLQKYDDERNKWIQNNPLHYMNAKEKANFLEKFGIKKANPTASINAKYNNIDSVFSRNASKETIDDGLKEFSSNPLSIPSGKGSFVSQLDYGNQTFADGESLAQAGCGPAVASMILNSGRGTDPTMQYAALYANKYKDEGGTKATYFNDILGKAGYNTNYISSGVSSGIKKSLKSGEQVIVMGQDASNTSKRNSPFGAGNHYVLATGMGNGKVQINDPEQHAPRLYSESILNKAKLGIGVSARGGFLGIRKYKKYSAKGSWDNTPSKILHQDLKMYGYNSVTAEQLNAFVRSKHSDSFWADKGEYFILASQATGLDPRYILAHAIHETGYTVSNIARDKNNFFGIGAFDSSPYESAYKFSGVAAGIIEGAKWINEHYYNGEYKQTTLYKMRFGSSSHNYATDVNWANKIANIWSGMPQPIADPQPDHMKYGQEINLTGISSSTEQPVEETTGSTWLDKIINGIEKAGKAYFGMSTTSASTTSSTSSSSIDYFTNPSADNIVNAARTYIGKLPYVYGGDNLETGADCSGFTSALFKKFGVSIPRTASAQYTNEEALLVDKTQLQPGDLVFFNYGNSGKAADHVGIYSGNNMYIHSPQTGEYVKESTLDPNSSTVIGGRRVKLPSASGSNLVKTGLSKISAKGTTSKSRQKLVSAIASISSGKGSKESIGSRVNVSKMIYGSKPVKYSKVVEDFSKSVKRYSDVSASGTGDSLIYEALSTIIQLQGQIAANTAVSAQYDKEVAELIKLSNQYMDQQSAKGTTVRRDNDKAKGTTNNIHKRHIPSGVSNIGQQQRSASDRQRLQATINRVKSLISN